MPLVEIPEKQMLVEFPEDMTPEEIDLNIRKHIIGRGEQEAVQELSDVPKGPGFWERMKQADAYEREVREVAGKAGAATISGIAAMIPAGIKGIGVLLSDRYGIPVEESAEAIEEIATWPAKQLIKTPQEEKAFETLGKPAEIISESAQYWGDLVYEKYKDKPYGPELAATTAASIEAIAWFVTPKLFKKMTGSTWFRRLSIRQRALTIQTLDETIRKNPKMSEGEILRKWNSDSFREAARKRHAKREEPPGKETIDTSFFEMREGESLGDYAERLKTEGERIKKEAKAKEEPKPKTESITKLKESLEEEKGQALTEAITAKPGAERTEAIKHYVDIVKTARELAEVEPEVKVKVEAVEKPIGLENQIGDAIEGPSEADLKLTTEKSGRVKQNLSSITKINGKKVYNPTIEGENIEYYLKRGGKQYYYPIKYAEIEYQPPPAPRDTTKELKTRTKPKPKAEKVKEPWEMTREEHRIFKMEQRAKIDIPSVSDAAKKAIEGYKGKDKRLVEKGWMEEFNKFDSEHERNIQQALSENKPVPAEVLKDYPDLTPSKPKKVYVGDYIKFKTKGGNEAYADVSKVFKDGDISIYANGQSFPIIIKPDQIINIEKSGTYRERAAFEEKQKSIVKQTTTVEKRQTTPKAEGSKKTGGAEGIKKAKYKPTLKEHKEKLLAKLDEAIKKEKKALQKGKETKPWVEFEIDGTKYKIANNKVALDIARKSAKSTKTTTNPPKPAKPVVKGKPLMAKKESFDKDWRKVEGTPKGEKWWTDGNIAVKGEYPKKGGSNQTYGWEGVKEVYDLHKKAKPATLKYYASEGMKYGDVHENKIPMQKEGESWEDAVKRTDKENEEFRKQHPDKKEVGISKEHIVQLSETNKPVVVFKSGKKYFQYNQSRFNVLNNRYPKAKWKIAFPEDKPASILFAMEKGKPVAFISNIRGGRERPIPGYVPQELIQGLKQAKKAGYANIGVYDTSQGVLFNSGAYDTGAGYASNIQSIIEMPEIVEIAKQLMKGKVPRIKRRLRMHMANGVFYPVRNGIIQLKANIFQDPAQAAAVLSHEIGHLVDYLPHKLMSRGNILGRIAKLKKYMKHTLAKEPGAKTELTETDRRRLRYQAKKLIESEYSNKWIDEVIIKELPISPQDVLNIWNAVEKAKLLNADLYEFVAKLNTAEKKAVVKEAMKGVVPEQLEQFAKKEQVKTGKKIKIEASPELIKKKYADLINKEIEKLRLFKLEEVTNELKNLTRTWKPFDPAANPKYTKYRYNSKELYADAFSALINAPGLVKHMAPNWYEGFFNYMERNPAAQSLYNQIQRDISTGAVEKKRIQRMYDMFRKGDDAYAKSLETPVKYRDMLARELIDADWFVLKGLKKIGERNVPADKNPRYKLEDLRYSGAEAEFYLVPIYREAVVPLEKAGLTWDDFGLYRFIKRIAAGDRTEMANPQGWTPDIAQRKLDAWKAGEKTPEQMKALDDAFNGTRKMHDYVIDKAEEAKIWDPELIKQMRDNEAYATFDVIKYIEERYGRFPSSHIYSQIGTLSDIANPATSTIMKDLSIIHATNRNIAAKSVVKLWRENFSDEITAADTKWNGKYHEIRPPRSPRQGLITYLDEGKIKGFYLPKYVADTFEANPWEGAVIGKMFRALGNPFRMVFTEINYGFWIFNAFFRDFQRALMTLPKTNIRKFVPQYLKGIKPAFRSVFGIPDNVINEMLKDRMLISVADVRGLRSTDKQIERLLKMYHFKKVEWDNKILKPFGQLFTYMTNVGRALERTTKVGSYKYLKKYFPDMPQDFRAHLVRSRGGSPDFLRKGRAYPIYNNILLFSNAMKEGYRGDYRAFADSPGEFMWKKAKYIYLPKILMYGAAIGLLGPEIKRIFDGATEYDKTNYIIIPLGLTESGKSVYFRVPVDETSRFMGGILWKILNHKELGFRDYATGLFDYMAGQAPTYNPAIEVVLTMLTYASGRNPYNWFTGKYAIPETVFGAQDKRAHIAMAKYIANQMGASIFYRFKHDDVGQVKGQLEKITGWPFMSNIVGRFVKVSDYGLIQEADRVIKEVKVEEFRERLDARDAMAKLLRGDEPITLEDIEAIQKHPGIIDRNLMKALARKYGHIYLEMFYRAQTNREKIAVLDKIYEKVSLEKE